MPLPPEKARPIVVPFCVTDSSGTEHEFEDPAEMDKAFPLPKYPVVHGESEPDGNDDSAIDDLENDDATPPWKPQ